MNIVLPFEKCAQIQSKGLDFTCKYWQTSGKSDGALQQSKCLHSPPAERVAMLERAGAHQTPILLQPLDYVFVCILKASRTDRTKSLSMQRIEADSVWVLKNKARLWLQSWRRAPLQIQAWLYGFICSSGVIEMYEASGCTFHWLPFNKSHIHSL